MSTNRCLSIEVLAALAVRPAGHYVDATYGRGGHSERILAALGPQGRLVAIDRDREAIEAGRARFASEGRLTLVHGAFGELAALLRAANPQVSLYDGILIDCGVSSPQLDNAARGFSFQKDGPLDMRMDPQRGEPVSDWLARASLEEMRNVIASFGQERFARRIASAIERERARATADAHRAAGRADRPRGADARARQAPGDPHLSGLAHDDQRRARPAATRTRRRPSRC